MMCSFIRESDIEGNKNRGWIVHKITAYDLTGASIGYIKISYISKERYNEWYKCPLDFMNHIMGWPIVREYCDSVKSTTESITHKSIQAASWYLWHNNDLYNKIPSMSQEELNNLFIAINRDVKKDYNKKLKEFYHFHVDKPIADFISVGESFRRVGVGTKLYLEGSRWMRENGLRLHASRCQTYQAQSAWKKFKQLGMTIVANSRLALI